jgi:hypothetical protein
LTVFSLDLHTNDLTRNGGLFVSSFFRTLLGQEWRAILVAIILTTHTAGVSTCVYCREMAGFKLVVFRELSQPGHKFIVFAKDNGVGSGTPLG